jgi:hypothetical protein
MKTRIGESCYFAPFRKAASLSVEEETDGDPFISRLLCQRSPSTIIRLVVFVIINAINGMLSWTGPHIFQEVFKGIPPAYAYANTAPAITFITFVFCIFATIDHSVPSSVSRRVSHSVRSSIDAGKFWLIAATRCSFAQSQFRPSNYPNFPAGTNTTPCGTATSCFRASAVNNRPKAKFLPGEIPAIRVVHGYIVSKTFGKGWTNRVIQTAIEAFQ